MTDVSVNLGDEHDEEIRRAIFDALNSLGAKALERWAGVGGSQDIVSQTFDIGGRKLNLETETYIGITATGDPETVEIFSNRVASFRRPG